MAESHDPLERWLYGGAFDADRARQAFRLGVRFLRWVEAFAGGSQTPLTEG